MVEVVVVVIVVVVIFALVIALGVVFSKETKKEYQIERIEYVKSVRNSLE